MFFFMFSCVLLCKSKSKKVKVTNLAVSSSAPITPLPPVDADYCVLICFCWIFAVFWYVFAWFLLCFDMFLLDFCCVFICFCLIFAWFLLDFLLCVDIFLLDFCCVLINFCLIFAVFCDVKVKVPLHWSHLCRPLLQTVDKKPHLPHRAAENSK